MSASSSLSSLSAQPAAIGSFHDDNSYSYNHIDCSGTKTTIPGLPRHPPLLTLIRAKPQKYSMLERKHGAKRENLLTLREINEILNTPIIQTRPVLTWFRRFSAKKAVEAVLVFSLCGIEPAPFALTGVKPYSRFKSISHRHQIAQRVIPRAPLVAIDGLIVHCIDFATQILPSR